ncbi:MAG: NAD(P)/FAD-dependent oxidoreductase [Hyphomicrobiaceae bacterium]
MAEFVIVGGGIYGVGVAFWLTQQGADVHLLEAKSIGAGASAGPGRRGTRANGRDLRELPLIRLAQEQWPSLHEPLGVPALFERSGHLLLFEHEEDLVSGHARALMQNQHGIETHILSAAQVQDREPGVSDQVIGALYCPHDGVTDHTAATNAFADATRRAGATVEEGTKVSEIEFTGERSTAVITDDGRRIEVRRGLYVLANAGVQSLLSARLELPVWSRTFQILLTNPQPNKAMRYLIGHASRTLAAKSENDNRVMISGGLPGSWDHQTESGTAIEPSISANFADAVAVFPGLELANIEIADADHLETVSIDNIPVIDLIPGTSNTIYATAWCGHGWAIAPTVTQLLAKWGTSGRRPDLLAAFGHARFSS